MEQFYNFPVTVYSELQPLSQTLSLARCMIFYKGINRNGSYITDEFGEKLAKTLPYAPIKGIYDNGSGDFTDHGARRDLGRIYGVVPTENHFAWESHLDPDGVTRVYACTDVILYTALYEEANDIVGKAQSMELYEPSIKGDWEIRNGQKCYVFTEGCFLGLQVLGDETEPCFEGSSFFELKNSLEAVIKQMEKFAFLTKQEDKQMDKLNFKLSDGQKYNALWALLNPNCTPEGNWTIDYSICEVYDSYAIAYNLNDNKYVRAYYTKDDATDSVKIDKTEECFIVDVNADEKAALNTLQTLKGTYSAAVEEFNSMTTKVASAEETLEKEKENFSKIQDELNTKISDYEEKINTLNTEKDNFSVQIQTLTTEKEKLSGQVEELSNYKLSKEKKEKEAVIATYIDKLSEEKITEYTAKIDEYTDLTSLKKDLAFELVETNPGFFSKKDPEVLIPTGSDASTGIVEVLEKYANKKKS